MSSHGWFDSTVLPFVFFDESIDPLAWFHRDLIGFDDQKRIDQSCAAWFDKRAVVELSYFDLLMEPLAWFGDWGGADNFPVLTAYGLSMFFVSPYEGSPFLGLTSAGASTTRRLVFRSGMAAPTVGAAVNARTSAYYDSTATGTFDPTTLVLSGYWRTNYTGLPWTATATAGISSSTGPLISDLNDPTTSGALNGHTGADFDGISQHAKGTATVSDASTIYSTTAFTIVVLANVRTTVPATGNIYDDTVFVRDTNSDIGISITNAGVAGYAYDGSYKTVSGGGFGGTNVVMLRFDGANLGITVNSAAEITVACGTLAVLTGDMSVGQAYAGLSYLDGIIYELITAKYKWSDADYANYKSYVNTTYGLAL